MPLKICKSCTMSSARPSELRVPCSPEQEDVIADHLFEDAELGMLPDERAWIIAQVAKRVGDAKILSADLDIGSAEWIVRIQ
jgi:hypothetical protein